MKNNYVYHVAGSFRPVGATMQGGAWRFRCLRCNGRVSTRNWVTVAVGMCSDCQKAKGRRAYMKSDPACFHRQCRHCTRMIRVYSKLGHPGAYECETCVKVLNGLGRPFQFKGGAVKAEEVQGSNDDRDQSDQNGDPAEESGHEADDQVEVQLEAVVDRHESLEVGSCISVHEEADAAGLTMEQLLRRQRAKQACIARSNAKFQKVEDKMKKNQLGRRDNGHIFRGVLYKELGIKDPKEVAAADQLKR